MEPNEKVKAVFRAYKRAASTNAPDDIDKMDQGLRELTEEEMAALTNMLGQTSR